MFSRVIKLLNDLRSCLTIFPVLHHIFWVSMWHSRALKLHEAGRQLGGGALCVLYVVWFWGMCLFKTGSSSAAQSGFELKIFMPRPLEHWDYSCEPPQLQSIKCLTGPGSRSHPQHHTDKKISGLYISYFPIAVIRCHDEGSLYGKAFNQVYGPRGLVSVMLLKGTAGGGTESSLL